MPSIRNSPIGDEVLLDAARECLLAVGWRRTTMTDVARRAGVSRMTVYRRWPDMQVLIADLMTRELIMRGNHIAVDGENVTAAFIASEVARAAAALRENALFRKVVEVDPELLLPYLLVRRGRTQEAFLDNLRAAIGAGQEQGGVRPGDAGVLARTVLLTAYGFVFSAHTMTEPTGDPAQVDHLFAELRRLLTGYLS
ncbi:TetR/AcrR family transcriptional regulator [Leekyejoonella antrihumi]|uniref:TetR/AcrR family transcriptional regulator n=1 Tax=Leekyejoonella antrihumi TaxID=1660198 RepID=A0A563E9L1_9MICO|nr:TetR/AcrR family transcriptional regulator [Leekyejoonella antrihumi]TWP38942.1 TetR/AcrR family transcriptional regulator [Leekyejoonella antrihumi]